MYSFLRNKQITAILFLFIISSSARAQAPAWQTAAAVFGTGAVGGDALISATAGDAFGNVYVVGSFSGSVNFSGIILNSGLGNDMFVAKWSSVSGRFIWVQRAGGTGGLSQIDAFAVAVSGTSVYVTGRFYQTVTIGSTNLTSAGAYDVFVAKLTDAGPTGSFAWAQRAGGTSNDIAYSIAARGTDVYVAGRFDSITANFGSNVLTATLATTADFFLAKLNDTGTTGGFTWAQQGVGAVAQVAVSGTNVYVTGSFSGGAAFGAIRLTGYDDAFVAKLTDLGSTGIFVWAQRIGGIYSDYASSVVVNGADVYVAGTFTGTVNFGNTVLTSGALIPVVYANIFVTKLTDLGSASSYVWAKQVGGLKNERGPILAIDGSTVYMAGNFQGSIMFGSTVLTCATNQAMDADVFIAKLIDVVGNSNFAWAKKAGGVRFDYATGVAVSGGKVFTCGVVEPPASFDNIMISQAGARHSFLASLIDGPLAVASPSKLIGFNISPNPAHGRATMQLPLMPGTTTATLTVLNILGRAVHTQTAPTNARAELDLTGLAPGLYAVRVTVGTQIATRRLVVE